MAFVVIEMALWQGFTPSASFPPCLPSFHRRSVFAFFYCYHRHYNPETESDAKQTIRKRDA